MRTSLRFGEVRSAPTIVKWCSYSSRVVGLEENWREADNMSALIPKSEQLQGAQPAGRVVSEVHKPLRLACRVSLVDVHSR